MKLSKRLEAIASFVQQDSIIADIGTDHAYIPIYLVGKGVAEFAFAMDVRTGPLQRAQKNIQLYGLKDRITTRLSDGVERLQQGEADTVIIAGMGGELLIHILENGRHLWDSVKKWVISPQSELYKVRLYLAKSGFCIIDEKMIYDEAKYYTIMQISRGDMNYEKDIYYRYGKKMIVNKDKVFIAYLELEKQKINTILSGLEQADNENVFQRREELIGQLRQIEEAKYEMQQNN